MRRASDTIPEELDVAVDAAYSLRSLASSS